MTARYILEKVAWVECSLVSYRRGLSLYPIGSAQPVHSHIPMYEVQVENVSYLSVVATVVAKLKDHGLNVTVRICFRICIINLDRNGALIQCTHTFDHGYRFTDSHKPFKVRTLRLGLARDQGHCATN